jgi:opacity protein-like surface antigen
MAMRAFTTMILALALAATAAAAAAEAPPTWTHATVVEAGGAVHDDVTLAWALDGFLLELTNRDGTVTTLSPDQVDKVKDGLGRDITDDVGAACPATGITYKLLGKGRTVPIEFGIMADAGGGPAWTTGSGDFAPSLALLGGVRVRVGERAHVRLGYRRHQVVESTSVVDREVESTTDELHLLVGVRMSHPRENNNYSYLEGGVAFIRFDERYEGEDGTVPAEDLTDLGFTLQGGVVLPLSKRVGVDLGGLAMLRPTMSAVSTGPLLMVGINAALTLR